MTRDHRFGRLVLGCAGRPGQRRRDDEPVALFHQRETYEAEPGFLAESLAVELRLGIRTRGMRSCWASRHRKTRSPSFGTGVLNFT
jgi:hypothetical protein